DPHAVRRLLPLAALLTLFAAPAAWADEIVVLKDPENGVATETREREQALGFRAKHRYTRGIAGFSADLDPSQVERLRDDPGVAAVVPDVPVRIAAPPSPPGVRRLARTAPGEARQAASGAVAVVDTGVDLDHPDLDVEPGANCIDPGAPPDDDHGHGTHVAGTIGALNDGNGVVGVAPGTTIYAVKVLN